MDQPDRNDETQGLDQKLAEFINAPIAKRSVSIKGHPTSVSLEQPFWDRLQVIAEARKCSLNALISEIDDINEGNLSSALRLVALALPK